MNSRNPNRPRVIHILRECVAAQARAYVVNPEHSLVVPTVFFGVLPEELILELIGTDTTGIQETLVSTSLVLVSFSVGRQCGSFHANLRRCIDASADDTHPPRLAITLPEEIALANGRMLFRVDTSNIVDLQCMVGLRGSHGGTLVAARVLDISDSGARLRIDGAGPELKLAEKVAITFSFHERRVVIDGVVRRREGSIYGLYFPMVIRSPELESPAELRGLVLALEREWLNRRIRTGDEGHRR